MPSHLGVFILSNIKRIMNNFVKDIIGFHAKNVDYTDTDSLQNDKKNLDVLDEAKFVGKELCQCKND